MIVQTCVHVFSDAVVQKYITDEKWPTQILNA